MQQQMQNNFLQKMSSTKSEAFYSKSKESDTKIPKETLRLKGQRGYNQRNTASLMLTPLNKKHLVATGRFNRVLKYASNQRKKLKGLKKKLSFSHCTRHKTKSEAKSISSTPGAKSMSSTLEQCSSHLAVETEEHNETCTQNKLTVNFFIRAERVKVENLKSSQRLMTEDREESYRLVNEIKETLGSIKGSETLQKSDDVNGKRNILSKGIEENNIQDFDKMEVLYSQINFKVVPIIIDVYNVTEVEHPDSVGRIPWIWFREEKFRLLSFVKYPLAAVKSAVLLAEDGFVYTGKGEAMDDAVTCYFCCVQKKRWKPNDVISDIHRKISPNCSMITKINCDNIPLRTSHHDSQNFDELLNQLNSVSCNELGRHSIQENANEGHEKQGHINPYSGDIDAVSENVSIQNDSTFHRPTTTRENTSEDMRRETLETNMSSFANLLTNQVPTPKTGRKQTMPSNIAVQSTLSSDSVTQNVASVPSTPQITLPHIPTAPRNTETNYVTNTSNSWHTSVVQGEQPYVAIASSIPLSSNSATISQTNVAIASSVPPTSNSATVSQTSVAIASSFPPTSNSAIASQTTANNGEKKSGKGPSYAELGIITERPKRPEYAVKETRKKTFDHWPAHHHLTPEDLSDAGFYYAGYSDCARCFYCGGGLRNWEDEDDVWVEHARWFPKCAYIRQQMGQVFVDTVQELNKTLDVISFEKVKESCKVPATTSSLDAKLEPLKRDPAVLTVVDIGYSLTDVLQVAKIIKGKDVILSSDALLTKLQELKKTRTVKTPPPPPMRDARSATVSNDEEAIRQLKERNNQLRQQTVCKICMDKEVAVVFLPCGHLVSCAECASAMKDCPVCRVTVKGVVRAFI